MEEIFGTRALHNEDVRNSTFDINGYRIVWITDLIKLTVHECFIEVKDKSLPSLNMLRLCAKKYGGTLVPAVS